MTDFKQLNNAELRERRSRLTDELAQIEQEEQNRETIPEEEELANILHQTLCSWNHIDGCSWDYEHSGSQVDWDGYAHRRYLQVAKTFMESVDAVIAIRVLTVLNKVR